MVRRRLDAELVRRHLARSREVARDLVTSGAVKVNGFVSDKPARQVEANDSIVVEVGADPQWVSRGSGKLIGALDAFTTLDVANRVALDAGASTGGFTAVLLDRGASSIYAVDVGYGQLAWVLRDDPRVVVMERTNVRNFKAHDLEPPPSLVVSDLSFISLRTVLPALRSVASNDADFVLMVKPQFEIGKDKLGKGGVVRDPADRAETIRLVARCAFDLGLGCAGVAASPLPGPSGNVEYFVWLAHGQPPMREDVLLQAIADGPA